MHEHWRILEAEHKPGRQSRDHPPTLRLRHPEAGLLEPSTLLHPGPQRDLPPIDRLEGFLPGGHSMYQRVMVAVLCGRTSTPAWTYWMPRIDTGIRLGSGVWHRPC